MNGENLYVTAVKIAGGKVVLEFIDLDNHRPYSTEEKNVPHPDLYNALKRLRLYLAQVYHYKTTDLIDKIDITGFSNKNESTFCVIKGTLTVPSGKKVAINSDAIDMDKELYGFEQDLDDVIADIRNEAEAFFFKGKTAELKIPFEESEQKELEEVEAELGEETVADDSVHDGKMAAAEPKETSEEELPADKEYPDDYEDYVKDLPEGSDAPDAPDVNPPDPKKSGVPGL